MPNPWDQPPYPDHGEDSEEKLFTCMGRITSNWERIEFMLARLYSTFLSGDQNFELVKRYGKPRIFRDRFAALAIAAEQFFVRSPNQEDEGQFDLLAEYLLGFSSRRNDVAHGIAFQVNRLTAVTSHFRPEIRDREAWLVVPPLHTIRSHGDDGLPLYAYCAEYLEDLGDWLRILVVHLGDFRDRFTAPLLRSQLPPIPPLPWPETRKGQPQSPAPEPELPLILPKP
jgi:hypothetical protein